ncbi:unnamed protein product [Heligmosomoides polygyrus]|uniref:AMP-dependent synthetase/ligase domain-containing protein n=1 Tax=Heligmosomoides polygyrus TaxID=6339 RepID=A0A3P7ZQJ8_HELPZ|nr:unnamed protein product [Heligmosomoides polygyrus]
MFIDDDKQVSYGDFLNRSGKYAGILNSKYQICKGDRVICRTSKTLDSVALYMACLQLGAIYIPVNPLYTQSETEHFVKDATPKLMVTCDLSKDKVHLERVANVVDEKSLSEKAKGAEAVLDIEHVENKNVACVLYTSGTTASTNSFNSSSRLLHMLPFFHVHGMFVSLNCSLFSHSTVIWRERFSVQDAIRLLPSTTVLMGVPTFYSRLLSSPKFNAELLHHLRLFTCGSAPLSTQLWKEFKSRTGHEILERYGMTEAQVICSNPYDDRRPGSVGKPIGDTKIRIGESGMVEIQSSSLFAGYWKNPKKTAEDFTEDKYFITGDLGAIDSDGSFLFSV